MAQTKTKSTSKSTSKPRSKKPSTSKSAKPATKSKSAPKSKASKAKAKPKSSSKPRRSSNGNGASRSNGSSSKHSNVEAVRNAVGDIGDKAKGAGKTVGKAASKAKVPLVAGGAAIAGAAGGMAIAASQKGRKGGIGKAMAKGSKAMARRPKIKVDSKDIAKAARGVGNFSAQVSEVAGGLESAASGRNGKHRSPIEVVLQGLTARR